MGGPSSFWPRQRRAVRLCRVDCGKHERLLVGASSPQTLDRTGQGELRSAEALEEVTPARDPERFELRQLGVDRRETALDPLRQHLFTGHDPVALEQQLAERPPARDRVDGGP